MTQLSLFSMQDNEKNFSVVCDSLGVENNTPAWPDKFGNAIRKWILDNGITPIRTLSLFSGAGGLDIGFSDIGFDIVASVEIEEKFCETLEMNTGTGKRFENSHVNCIDIREFSSKDLGEIDFIIGGVKLSVLLVDELMAFLELQTQEVYCSVSMSVCWKNFHQKVFCSKMCME